MLIFSFTDATKRSGDTQTNIKNHPIMKLPQRNGFEPPRIIFRSRRNGQTSMNQIIAGNITMPVRANNASSKFPSLRLPKEPNTLFRCKKFDNGSLLSDLSTTYDCGIGGGSVLKQKGVWRDRLWFIARLFTAWAVISLMAGIVLVPINLIVGSVGGDILVAASDGKPGLSLIYFSLYAAYLFFGGYFVSRFFHEHWLKVGLGIPLINYAIIAWYAAWQSVLGYGYSKFSYDLSVVITFLMPFMITLGVLARRYLPPGQVRPRIQIVVRRLRRWH